MFYYQWDIFCKPTVEKGRKVSGIFQLVRIKKSQTLVLDVNGIKAIPGYLRAQVPA